MVTKTSSCTMEQYAKAASFFSVHKEYETVEISEQEQSIASEMLFLYGEEGDYVCTILVAGSRYSVFQGEDDTFYVGIIDKMIITEHNL